MPRWSLAAIAAAVFVVVVLVRLPLGLILGGAELPVSYSAVTGSIWDGRVTGLASEGQPIGDADISLHFLPLLTGNVRGEVSLDGRGVAGQGTVGFSGGALRMSDAAGTAQLGSFELYDAFGQPLRGEVAAEIDTLVLGPDGCRAAAFSVRTDALRRSLGVYADRGFELSGTGRCEGADLVVPLSGESGDADVEAEFRLEPSGRYVTTLAVLPKAPELGPFLEGAGFRREGDRLVSRQEGRVELF